jgi:hypothetical protein
MSEPGFSRTTQDGDESETFPASATAGPSLPPGLVAAGKAVSIVSSVVGEAVTLQQFLGKPHAVLALLLLSLFFAVVVFAVLSPGKRKAAAPVVLALAALVTVSAFRTAHPPTTGSGGPGVSASSTSSAVALNNTATAPPPSTIPAACCHSAQPGPAASATTVIVSASNGTGTGPGPRPTTATDPLSSRTTAAPSSSAPVPPCCQPPPTSSTGSAAPPTDSTASASPAIVEPAKHNTGELTLPNDGATSADLDSTASDWGVHKGPWTGSGIAYGGDGLGLSGSPGNTALMGSGGGWTYASCRTDASYGSAAQGTAIDPGHGICYETNAGRQALIVVKSRTDSAITLDITVWD